MPWWQNWGLKGAVPFEVWESFNLPLPTKSESEMLGKEKGEKEFSFVLCWWCQRGAEVGSSAVAPYVQSLPAGIREISVVWQR